jgi:hypothetical protein
MQLLEVMDSEKFEVKDSILKDSFAIKLFS